GPGRGRSEPCRGEGDPERREPGDRQRAFERLRLGERDGESEAAKPPAGGAAEAVSQGEREESRGGRETIAVDARPGERRDRERIEREPRPRPAPAGNALAQTGCRWRPARRERHEQRRGEPEGGERDRRGGRVPERPAQRPGPRADMEEIADRMARHPQRTP